MQHSKRVTSTRPILKSNCLLEAILQVSFATQSEFLFSLIQWYLNNSIICGWTAVHLFSRCDPRRHPANEKQSDCDLLGLSGDVDEGNYGGEEPAPPTADFRRSIAALVVKSDIFLGISQFLIGIR